MNILIAVPCMDQVPAHFAQSLAMLDKGGNGCAVAFQVGSLIYNSRNDLAAQAVRMEADYILWLDSDMVFPRDLLGRLLDDREKGDIVSGLYYRRVHPYNPVAFSKLSVREDGNGCDYEDLKEIPDDVFEVEGVGFGCVLMPTDVVLSVMAKYTNCFMPVHGMGEDLSFCWRARECGYKIVVDPKIPLGHVGNQIVTRTFYETLKKGGNT